jgi:hypothetical protein
MSSTSQNEGASDIKTENCERSVSIGVPSRTATAANGFNNTNDYLRSLLIHPIGLALTIFLNEKFDSELLDYSYWNILPEGSKSVFNECRTSFLASKKDIETCFQATTWDNHSEKTWASRLLDDRKKYYFADDLLVLKQQKRFQDGQVDAIIYKNSNANDSPKSVVSIIEFGLNNREWWKKVDQILMYVNKLQEDAKNKYVFDQPIILGVFTVDSIEKTTEDQDKKRNRSNCVDNDPPSRFGVFLCTRRANESSFRIALLWRNEVSTQVEATIEFVKFYAALQISVKCRQYTVDQEKYEYFGPNCCKIGDRVSLFTFVHIFVHYYQERYK